MVVMRAVVRVDKKAEKKAGLMVGMTVVDWAGQKVESSVVMMADMWESSLAEQWAGKLVAPKVGK